MTLPAEQLLASGVLDGVGMVVAGPPTGGGAGEAVAIACERLGAQVRRVEVAADRPWPDDEDSNEADVLVNDGAGLFASALGGSGDGLVALRACADACWVATRAVVCGAFLAGGGGARGGRVISLAPPPDAGPHADAARAALENMSRTVSIEWSGDGVTAVAVALGAGVPVEEVGALAAYLASPGGAYFSGCQLDMRGIV